jgi:hypothetical protein
MNGKELNEARRLCGLSPLVEATQRRTMEQFQRRTLSELIVGMLAMEGESRFTSVETEYSPIGSRVRGRDSEFWGFKGVLEISVDSDGLSFAAQQADEKVGVRLGAIEDVQKWIDRTPQAVWDEGVQRLRKQYKLSYKP